MNGKLPGHILIFQVKYYTDIRHSGGWKGAFLLWRSEIEDEHFRRGIAIFCSDDATGEFFMLYFDERKVSRKYDVLNELLEILWIVPLKSNPKKSSCHTLCKAL